MSNSISVPSFCNNGLLKKKNGQEGSVTFMWLTSLVYTCGVGIQQKKPKCQIDECLEPDSISMTKEKLELDFLKAVLLFPVHLLVAVFLPQIQVFQWTGDFKLHWCAKPLKGRGFSFTQVQSYKGLTLLRVFKTRANLTSPQFQICFIMALDTEGQKISSYQVFSSPKDKDW